VGHIGLFKMIQIKTTPANTIPYAYSVLEIFVPYKPASLRLGLSGNKNPNVKHWDCA
jgi:hypothetical protein